MKTPTYSETRSNSANAAAESVAQAVDASVHTANTASPPPTATVAPNACRFDANPHASATITPHHTAIVIASRVGSA